MPLTISLQFPTGRYVAASWSDKDKVEWPPHPARLFLGLVDTLHKAGNPSRFREALQWLCEQTAPSLTIPRDAPNLPMDGFFVPQNPSQASYGIKHPRKARAFPSICLADDEATIFFHWPGSQAPSELRETLSELLAALPRFGHSSSFVIAAVSERPPPEGEDWQSLIPDKDGITDAPDKRLRVNYPELLISAELAFQADERSKELSALLKKNSKNPKVSATLKPASSSRGRHDPRHHWQGYSEKPDPTVPRTLWDSRLLIMKLEGDRQGLTSIWQLAEVFHKTLLDRWNREPANGPIPAWLSGHRNRENTEATPPTKLCHLAILPLPFVESAYADGHILGLALALPEASRCGLNPIQMRLDWRKALASLLGEDERLELVPKDKAWRVQLTLEQSPDPRVALTHKRWTEKSVLWKTVSPIILDRHPKPHFQKNPAAWQVSCQEIIAKSCERIGLPKPIRIEASPYSSLQGVPPSSDFAAPTARSGRPPRFHIHAEIEFAEPVSGPLSLGAGRFRGYGFCLPIKAQPSSHV
ncbi:type I-U CRISPR-associated protein Csb2 [Roseibacillus persicicus]|uniref:type I-G CRISPR-associated protein Csb2 n=1 Tax=Roseibacillus persicicus TaxID=454148 RepID=UPI00398AE808